MIGTDKHADCHVGCHIDGRQRIVYFFAILMAKRFVDCFLIGDLEFVMLYKKYCSMMIDNLTTCCWRRLVMVISYLVADHGFMFCTKYCSMMLDNLTFRLECK